ncbi:hypothetical protein G6F70_007437 [Rhizopus microsporus]|uniref:Protein kinase domain-containing protein n=2 Tax=Rhizopus TaxID=4842 RepID=A0A367JY56_RHIAZ|nr:hypothetical protein G6F71_007418 [Rhizopus microsporus]RCH94863.1 hypothetical protein CU097_003014 [Rhizopus azygosporus]KAG1196462.1 hypothetical protein G6F70_007437 [Rhizopus microsporus]KAG1208201.1 hypothetical protein G6F69_007428 [Rhizopus microsporus]KAG1229414.1 hypothetical protein G6F67_007174 [Rhizopus microsporus]
MKSTQTATDTGMDKITSGNGTRSKSNQPDSDEDSPLAMESLDRLDENDRRFSEDHSDSIAEYCAESLYSFSFTPLSRVHKATKIKKQLLSRGMDYMQRIRWNTAEEDKSRRFSQPDIGISETDEWSTSELKLSPSVNDLVRHHLITQAKQKELDDEEFPVGRRQTIEAFNHLDTIREVPTSTSSAQYNHAIHAPCRFLPQNQSIVTTDSEATILLFNDMASLCLGIDQSFIGKSILTTLDNPIQRQLKSILKRRRNVDFSEKHKGVVLVCGIVVPIRKMSGEKSAASLWLKEKITDEGNAIYIWILEEIYETSLIVRLDSHGNILGVDNTIKDLFGYEPEDVIGKSITQLIPGISKEHGEYPDLQQIEKVKYYGGLSRKGLAFPTIISSSSRSNDVLKIVSLPSVAGLITVHINTGKIQSINPVPAKYLFGYSPETLVEKFKINQIIPRFSNIVSGLRNHNLLQYSCTVNNHVCRWAISGIDKEYQSMSAEESLKSLERRPSINASGHPLPTIHAVHRDGSSFEIQIQLRLIESDKEDLISVWVTYDRIQAIERQNRKLRRKQKQEQHHQELEQIRLNNLQQSSIVSPPPPTETSYPVQPKRRPPIRSYGISSFGNVDESKALFPKNNKSISRESLLSSSAYTSSEESLPLVQKSPVDDYVILNNLGEGAFGAVKLAYRRDDPNKEKVVIKFIRKDRIVVHSWIRDRKLGLVPMEIHILKKLKDNPHANCCSLESFMEDDETFYAVMKFHGSECMDLFDYVELHMGISEIEIKRIFWQIAKAVEHIHGLRIVHRDIKDENVLIDENGRISLIDFGSAAYFKEGRKFDTFCGTLDYCAPEIVKGMPYEGPPQDIYCLGIVLYILIYKANPFVDIDKILDHNLEFPYVLSEASVDLIKGMLDYSPEKRFTIAQVLSHPWLQNVSYD